MRFRSSRQAAYTFTEILVVIGILVLVMAMAVPAFNFITGRRSLASAQNTLSAMLGSARALALYHGKPAGMYCFVDPARGRLTMALVQADSPDGTSLSLVGRDRQPLQPTAGVRGIAEDNSTTDQALIVFDGLGRLSLTRYTPPDIGNGTAPALVQLGLVLHERGSYENQPDPGAADTWLRDNGSFLMINRYNGTFLRNE